MSSDRRAASRARRRNGLRCYSLTLDEVLVEERMRELGVAPADTERVLSEIMTLVLNSDGADMSAHGAEKCAIVVQD